MQPLYHPWGRLGMIPLQVTECLGGDSEGGYGGQPKTTMTLSKFEGFKGSPSICNAMPLYCTYAGISLYPLQNR